MSRRRFPIYDIEPERPSMGEQIRDIIEAEDAFDAYRERMQMRFEAKNKPKEKKEEPKKSIVSYWIMLGTLSVPIAAMWLLTTVGSVVLAARMLKSLN